MTLFRTFICTTASAFSVMATAATSSPAGGEVQFNRDIRPILAEACFHCHGPDPGTRKAGLRLDTEAGFFSASEEAPPTVVKHEPAKSPMFERITSSDPDEVMPPPESHKNLTAEQKDLIKRWIEQGAKWQPHWSFIKPERPAQPAVKHEAWVRNPIDRFVLASLEAKGLTPNEEADRRTLARRVSLDLTGLPPTPEAVEAFVKDMAGDAYEKFIDKCLNSERYGEHRARYWLDAARYGDTHGMHFDNYREMWPYRDWVISAFNANQPFDQFTVEQIAGDLLPKPSESQLIATGFQRCNITTNEGGTIDDENLALYAADRVQTLGWVYMGLTTNCSQCHDHKFDPISQKDYYAMAAFFRNTTQPPKDGNVKDSTPSLVLPSKSDRPRWEQLGTLIATSVGVREKRRLDAKAPYEKWLAQAKPENLDEELPKNGLLVALPLNEGQGNEVTTCGGATKYKTEQPVTWTPGGKLGSAPVIKRGSTFDLGKVGDFELNQGFSYGAWIKPSSDKVSGGIIARMDQSADHRGWDLFQSGGSVSVHIINTWPQNALKVSTQRPTLRIGQWQHVFVTWNGSGKPEGVKIYINGVEQKTKTDTNTLKPASSIRTVTATRLGQRSRDQFFDGGSLQDARIYDRALTPAEVKELSNIAALMAALKTPAEKRTADHKNTLFNHYLVSLDQPYQEAESTLVKLEGERDAIKARSPLTHIQQEKMGTKAMANILMRGQYDQVGEAVEANTPAALTPLPPGAPRNRLGLAQWLVSPENPLTARVTVNRIWQELFGTGLVKTPEDFGIMGTAPSHPELLDWLAIEFRDTGWDLKRFYKLLCTSAAYRQNATVTREKLEVDPNNTLLSRGQRFRMDAEMLRDYALSVSGTLSSKMGGPGTKPYQPSDIWNQVGLGNTRDYVQDSGENVYRRTIYNFWKRMAPSPNMEIFNAPSREVTCVRRERTNTPLQALVTMNDPQFVEAARFLAWQTTQKGQQDVASIAGDIANRVLCRPARPEELQIILASYQDLLKHYQESKEDAQALLGFGDRKIATIADPADLAAWTMVCNQMLNLDEVLTK